MAKKKIREQLGDIMKITLPQGWLSYGRVLESPLMAFYEARYCSEVNNPDKICADPVAFRVWVTDAAIISGKWPVVGNKDLDARLTQKPRFFKQDIISKKFSIYTDGVETPCTRDDCVGLERASVWAPEHIEERLTSLFAGSPSRYLNMVKLPD